MGRSVWVISDCIPQHDKTLPTSLITGVEGDSVHTQQVRCPAGEPGDSTPVITAGEVVAWANAPRALLLQLIVAVEPIERRGAGLRFFRNDQPTTECWDWTQDVAGWNPILYQEVSSGR